MERERAKERRCSGLYVFSPRVSKTDNEVGIVKRERKGEYERYS